MAQNSGFCSPMSTDRSADYQLSVILIPGRSYVYQILALTELSTMAVRINRKKSSIMVFDRKIPKSQKIENFRSAGQSADLTIFRHHSSNQ